MLRIQPLILALSLGLASFMQVAAQQYTYTTSTITSCGPDASGGPGGAGGAAPTLLGPGNLIVGMPPCPACDCNTCVHSNIYTTSFGAFCPHGTTAMAYTITEVYSGMSAVPTLADRPHCPPGFTTAVETCTVCGEQPITATMTYPVGGSPYVPEMAVATQTGSPGKLFRYQPSKQQFTNNHLSASSCCTCRRKQWVYSLHRTNSWGQQLTDNGHVGWPLGCSSVHGSFWPVKTEPSIFGAAFFLPL